MTKTTKLTVSLNEADLKMLDSMIDCTPTSRAELLRQLLRAEFQRRREESRRRAAPQEPTHTADGGIIIDGVLFTADERLFTADERLTSLDDRVRR
jgi:hypothetical protein